MGSAPSSQNNKNTNESVKTDDDPITREIKADLKLACKNAESFYSEDLKSNNYSSFTKQFKLLGESENEKFLKVLSDVQLSKKFPELFIKLHEKYLIGTEDSIYTVVDDIITVLRNGTEISQEFCKEVLEANVLQFIIEKILTNWRFEEENIANKDFKILGLLHSERLRAIKGYLNIVHNVLRSVDKSREIVRDINGIETFQELLSVDKPEKLDILVQALCSIIVAYLMQKVEYDDFDTSKEVIEFISNIIKGCLETKDHRYKEFSLDVILMAMNRLAINNNNKEVIADRISCLFDVIKSPLNEKEEEYALECLLTLSDGEKCAKILNLEENYSFIYNLSINSKNIAIVRTANDIICQLHQENTTRVIPRINHAKNEYEYVMFSCHFSDKELTKAVYMSFKDFNVWFDGDFVNSLALASPEEAIENSSIVFVFFSQEYRNNEICFKEAKLALELKKRVIFLQVEKDCKDENFYNQCGENTEWLDFITGRNQTLSNLQSILKSSNPASQKKKLSSSQNLKYVKRYLKIYLQDALSLEKNDFEIEEKIFKIHKLLKFVAFSIESRMKLLNNPQIVKKLSKLFKTLHKYFFLETLKYVKIFDDLITLFWNGTDINARFGKSLLDNGIIKFLVENVLINWKFNRGIKINRSSETENSTPLFVYLLGDLSILYNVLRMVDESRKVVRDMGAIEILQKLQFVQNFQELKELETIRTISLAYIIREDESSKVDTNYGVIKFISDLLEGGLQTASHTYEEFSVIELLLALNRLAVSEKNKELLVESIHLLMKVINFQNSPDEEEEDDEYETGMNSKHRMNDRQKRKKGNRRKK